VNITRETAQSFFTLPNVNSLLMLHITGGKDHPIMLGGTRLYRFILLLIYDAASIHSPYLLML
jgi:hypothetical protein